MEDKENGSYIPELHEENKENWYDGAITCYLEREER